MTPRSWEYSGPEWRRSAGWKYVAGHEWDDATRDEFIAALDAAARENDWLASEVDRSDDLYEENDDLRNEIVRLNEQIDNLTAELADALLKRPA